MKWMVTEYRKAKDRVPCDDFKRNYQIERMDQYLKSKLMKATFVLTLKAITLTHRPMAQSSINYAHCRKILKCKVLRLCQVVFLKA